MRVFLIHGAYGSPNGNWFPWVKNELEKENQEVIVPEFPTPKNQNLKKWMEIFEPYFNQIKEDSLFVGHSLGCAFLLAVLERIKVKKTIFIAGFLGEIGNPDFDEINKTFTKREFNWEKIKRNCKEFKILYSDNDPYVHEEKAFQIAQELGIEPTLIENGGHFNKDAGFLEFPQLIEEIWNGVKNHRLR